MPPIAAPGLLHMALELRAPWEFGASLAALPLLPFTAHGDGHPVVVFPGLIASDISTGLLRAFLRARGYDTHAWSGGRNLGPRTGVMEACERQLRALSDNGRKVSLVGWSLGGIFARELARKLPQRVRSVITLGTPFAGSPAATNAGWVYEVASGETIAAAAARWPAASEAPPVPTTSIFSRTDGVVSWECSFQVGGREVENIEVDASHIGLGVHPRVLAIIADRLAQPEGAWQPYASH